MQIMIKISGVSPSAVGRVHAVIDALGKDPWVSIKTGKFNPEYGDYSLELTLNPVQEVNIPEKFRIYHSRIPVLDIFTALDPNLMRQEELRVPANDLSAARLKIRDKIDTLMTDLMARRKGLFNRSPGVDITVHGCRLLSAGRFYAREEQHWQFCGYHVADLELPETSLDPFVAALIEMKKILDQIDKLTAELDDLK